MVKYDIKVVEADQDSLNVHIDRERQRGPYILHKERHVLNFAKEAMESVTISGFMTILKRVMDLTTPMEN